jgi:glycine/D-amino acid oxidase-like deaminating enzyme
MPLTRHISRNVSFRPQGAGYISGNTRYDEPPGFNWEVDYPYFDEAIWPGLADRVPAFEALKMTSAWAGHYDQNSLDNNAILGPWVGGLENFLIALGFSGHGLMQAPAVGRGLSELLLHGSYQTLGLSRLGYQRHPRRRAAARRGAQGLKLCGHTRPMVPGRWQSGHRAS